VWWPVLAARHRRRHLNQYGVHTRAARNTALITLAADLSAAVLAELFGLHISTAVRWTRAARRVKPGQPGAPQSVQRVAERGRCDSCGPYAGGTGRWRHSSPASPLMSSVGSPGPFELLDVVGNDVSLAIQRELYLEFREPGYAPAPLLEHLVTASYLGRKTGRGFRYDS
jgi:hypothetical protein